MLLIVKFISFILYFGGDKLGGSGRVYRVSQRGVS